MKIFKILSLSSACILFTLSCSKEDKNDVEVHTVQDNTNNHMSSGETLHVEVVNEFDPICGMDNAIHLKDTANYQGKTYGFCNTMCKEKFSENPTEYINE